MARKILPFILSCVLAVGLMSAVAWAAPEEGALQRSGAPQRQTTITPTVTATPPVSPTAPGQTKIAETIMDVFGVTMSEVMAIRKTTGWGNVYRIFRLAQQTNVTPDEIADMRATKGWGPIYKELGARPGKGNNLGQAVSGKGTDSTDSHHPSRSNDNDRGRGQSNNGKGNSNDKGKGNDNGKGKGK
jgi:hypothetical protein